MSLWSSPINHVTSDLKTTLSPGNKRICPLIVFDYIKGESPHHIIFYKAGHLDWKFSWAMGISSLTPKAAVGLTQLN